jgi:hypothetical protein
MPHTLVEGGKRERKWRGGERFGCGSGECVQVQRNLIRSSSGLGEDVADLSWECKTAQRTRNWSWLCCACQQC